MSAVNERVRISDISGLIKFIKELSSSDAAVADAYIEAYRELSGDADLSDREREYYRAVAGCEHLGENSERCYRCYAFRMKKAAAMAEGYDYFTTTLSISPYKHAEWINALGAQLEAESEAKYLPADFKKKGGYQRSIELCKAYDIYRQDYCGCIFSRGESRKKIRHGEQKT